MLQLRTPCRCPASRDTNGRIRTATLTPVGRAERFSQLLEHVEEIAPEQLDTLFLSLLDHREESVPEGMAGSTMLVNSDGFVILQNLLF